MAMIGCRGSALARLTSLIHAVRGQHSAALGQFEGEELYAPPTSEPTTGSHAHRTNTFVREVP
jgi:hypothetical protein